MPRSLLSAAPSAGSSAQLKHATSDLVRTSSNTMTDVPGLTGFEVKAATLYAVRGYFTAEDGGGNIKTQFNFDNTPAGQGLTYFASNTVGAVLADQLEVNTILYSLPVDGQRTGYLFFGFFEGHATLDAIVDYQFAQNTVDGVASTIYKGSWIELVALS